MTIIRLILKDGERPLKNKLWFDTRADACTLQLEGQFVRVDYQGSTYLIPLFSVSHLEVEPIAIVKPKGKKRKPRAKASPPPLVPSSAPQVAVPMGAQV